MFSENDKTVGREEITSAEGERNEDVDGIITANAATMMKQGGECMSRWCIRGVLVFLPIHSLLTIDSDSATPQHPSSTGFSVNTIQVFVDFLIFGTRNFQSFRSIFTRYWYPCILL